VGKDPGRAIPSVPFRCGRASGRCRKGKEDKDRNSMIRAPERGLYQRLEMTDVACIPGRAPSQGPIAAADRTMLSA
jgi:hypothetical protein